MISNRLRTARRNTAYLLGFLYVQDIFWFLISRSGFISARSYKVAPFDWVYFVAFVSLSLLFCGVAIFLAHLMRPLPRFEVSKNKVMLIIAATIALNIMAVILVDPAARYRGGEFTKASWAVYVLSNAFSLAAVMLIIRQNDKGDRIPIKWTVGLLVSYAVTIDGMAPALTLFMFVYLIFDFGRLSVGKILGASLFAVGLFWFGFNAKFKDVPHYVTPEFIVQWSAARFSIQAEQMYTYISDNSIIGSEVSYVELLSRSASNRFDLLLGKPYIEERPKNVPEAMSYDMHGGYIDSGSSPGILTSTALQGPVFFIVVPLIFSFVFLQHFYGVLKKLSFWDVVAYSFCFKILHANFSALFSIVNPTVISISVFLLCCLLTTKEKSPVDP